MYTSECKGCGCRSRNIRRGRIAGRERVRLCYRPVSLFEASASRSWAVVVCAKFEHVSVDCAVEYVGGAHESSFSASQDCQLLL